MNETFYINFFAPIVDESCGTLLRGINHTISTVKPKTIHIGISSPGGSVPAAIGVYNILRGLPVEIITHNIGNVDSAANIIFMAANKRYANQQSSFLFHGISITLPPNLSLQKLKEITSQIEIDHKRIAQIISSGSSLEEAKVESFFQQGISINVEGAIQNGIVTEKREFIIPPNGRYAIIS